MGYGNGKGAQRDNAGENMAATCNHLGISPISNVNSMIQANQNSVSEYFKNNPESAKAGAN